MSKSYQWVGPVLVFSSLTVTFSLQAAMPAAGLPIEPATDDAELNQPSSMPRSPGRPNPVAPAGFEKSASSSARMEGLEDFGAALRLTMVQSGFGAQLRVSEYPLTWLAMTQTFRYFKNDEAERLYNQREGFLIGVTAHPWRKVFVSPFLDLQAGLEKYHRDEGAPNLDTFVMEASAGLELRLGRMASLVGQWTEAYSPGLKEAVYLPAREDEDVKRHSSAEFLFNLRWESGM